MLGNRAMKHSAEDLLQAHFSREHRAAAPFADEGLSLVLSSKAEHLKRF